MGTRGTEKTLDDRFSLTAGSDIAVREYAAEVARRRAGLERAEAEGVSEAVLDGLREVLCEWEAKLGRAQAWAERDRSRARIGAARGGPGPADRKRARLARVPLLARDSAIETGERNVPSPYSPGQVERVTVNRRVDILAQERATGRITEAQMLVGRMIQAVYERASGARLGSGGWAQSSNRDQTIAHELQIIFAIEDAQRVRKFTDRLERAIGSVGARFLRAILCEGKTFGDYAAERGRGGERAVTDVAKRFRWLLETLTEEQHSARGARVEHEEYERTIKPSVPLRGR